MRNATSLTLRTYHISCQRLFHSLNYWSFIQPSPVNAKVLQAFGFNVAGLFCIIIVFGKQFLLSKALA